MSEAQPEFVWRVGQPAEDWLWQHCHLRYFAPAGLVANGAKHFWKRL